MRVGEVLTLKAELTRESDVPYTYLGSRGTVANMLCCCCCQITICTLIISYTYPENRRGDMSAAGIQMKGAGANGYIQ